MRSELKEQEQKVKELSEVIKQYNVNNLDFAKLFEVAHVKAEVAKLTEERDELKIKLSEVEGAHQLLEGMEINDTKNKKKEQIIVWLL